MGIKCLINGLEVNYPCSPACALFGDCVTAFEANKKASVRTNADRIRAMTDEELAEIIYKGVSSDPCDYCKQNNLHCDGSPCQGKADVETIIEWLQQPCEAVHPITECPDGQS